MARGSRSVWSFNIDRVDNHFIHLITLKHSVMTQSTSASDPSWNGNWVQNGLRVGSRIERERCIPILSYSNPPIRSIQPPSPWGAGTFILCIIQRDDTFGHQASTRMTPATLVPLYFFGQSREDHTRDNEANQVVLIRQTELQPLSAVSHGGNELWPSHHATSPTCHIPGPWPTHKLQQE